MDLRVGFVQCGSPKSVRSLTLYPAELRAQTCAEGTNCRLIIAKNCKPGQPPQREPEPLSRSGSPEVNLSRVRAITTGQANQASFVLNDLRDGMRLALSKTDEVARNGVLQRITSARGFL